MTDDFLRLAAKGDTVALGELIESKRAQMLSAARLFCPESAEDIVQIVCEILVRRREKLAEVENLDRWLFCVVKNCALNELRKRGARETVSYDASPALASSLSSEDDLLALLIRREEENALRQSLNELPPPLSEPLLLYYDQGLPLKKVAALLGISYETAKWRVHTGRRLLKKSLCEKGIERSSP